MVAPRMRNSLEGGMSSLGGMGSMGLTLGLSFASGPFHNLLRIFEDF